MVDSKKRNSRGFRVFLEQLPQRYGAIGVTESSLASAGAHCWIFQDAHGGRPDQGIQINVAGAKLVREALTTFIEEAEKGELTEAVDPPEDEDEDG